jgi:hypothetical protein
MLELHAELRDQPVQVGSIRADSLFDARAVASRPLFATLAFDVETCQEFDVSGTALISRPSGTPCSRCLRGELVFGAFITTEARRTRIMH